MKIHEVCSIFPMMSSDEYESLKENIHIHGQREPIWTYQDTLIDGRNRLKACEELGITPKIREWDGVGSLTEFVVSLNLHRRHLNPSQRAVCAEEISGRLEKEAKDRQSKAGKETHSNQYSSLKTVQLVEFFPQAAPTASQRAAVAVEIMSQSPPHTGPLRVIETTPRPSPVPAPKSRDRAAKIVGTNPRYIQDSKTIKQKSPELHEKIKNGQMNIPQAKRQIARDEKRALLEDSAKKFTAIQDIEPIKTWEIIQGDCLEILKTITPGSIRLAFADPPYNINISYGDHYDDKRPAQEYLAWCQRWINAVVRVLAADGSFWVLINDEWADHFGILLRQSGLHRRRWLIWYETFGNNNSNNFNNCSRHLFYMVKNKDNFIFNADAVKRPSDRQTKYHDSRAEPGGKIWDSVWGINPPIPRLVDNAKERIPDVPTQLPLALLLPIVGCASHPGDLILDPFSGTGTTGAACIKLNRRYKGIELSERYVDLSRKRLTIEQGIKS